MESIEYKIEKTDEFIKIIFEMPGYTYIQELPPNLTEEQVQEEIAKVTSK